MFRSSVSFLGQSKGMLRPTRVHKLRIKDRTLRILHHLLKYNFLSSSPFLQVNYCCSLKIILTSLLAVDICRRPGHNILTASRWRCPAADICKILPFSFMMKCRPSSSKISPLPHVMEDSTTSPPPPNDHFHCLRPTNKTSGIQYGSRTNLWT